MVDYAYENTRNDAVAVGTSSVIVSKSRTQEANQDRKTILLRNISTNVLDIITINFGSQQATSGTGIVLKVGESTFDTTDTGYRSYQGTITAVCDTANGNLAVFER